MKMPVILASGSPQRADVMRELGIDFEAISMDVDEAVLPTPEETVEANAKLKAIAALKLIHDERPIIAADTVLCVDRRILGKPGSPERAREYLELISGRSVMAVSAVAAVRKGDKQGWLVNESAVADVRRLSKNEIDCYIMSGEPLTRAGAIGISRYGEIFIDGIRGSYSCFAGLPKRALLAVLDHLMGEEATFPYGLRLAGAMSSDGLKIEKFTLL